jgi:ParB-like chromosome segregation protein Spo0J
VTEIPVRQPELVAVADLKAHPRNYRHHPPAQIEHIVASFRAFGVLPTIVVARDGTILGGHGVWITARSLGVPQVPATRLDLDPHEPAALKLVAALNFSDRLALDDEQALAALLADATEHDLGALLGTGLTADDLTNMIARADPALPEGFRHLTPPDPAALGENGDAATAALIVCPVCGHQFIPGDER